MSKSTLRVMREGQANPYPQCVRECVCVHTHSLHLNQTNIVHQLPRAKELQSVLGAALPWLSKRLSHISAACTHS